MRHSFLCGVDTCQMETSGYFLNDECAAVPFGEGFLVSKGMDIENGAVGPIHHDGETAVVTVNDDMMGCHTSHPI